MRRFLPMLRLETPTAVLVEHKHLSIDERKKRKYHLAVPRGNARIAFEK